MTVEEYERFTEIGALPKNVELLRGILVTKMSKSPLHEFVRQTLLRLLFAKVPSGFTVRAEAPIKARDSEPEPDLSVVKGSANDWVLDHPNTAHLAIEVSISSTAVDESKADIYAEAAVQEYWLVYAELRTVDVYRQPTPEGYLSKMTLTPSDTLHCQSIPEIQLAVADIFPA